MSFGFGRNRKKPFGRTLKMFDFLHHILGEKTQPKTSQIALVQKQQQELSALSKIETGKGNAPSQHSALKQARKTVQKICGV